MSRLSRSMFCWLPAFRRCRAPRAVRGCVAEFRSTDWQVCQSPLVIVGKVVEVTPEVLPAQAEAMYQGGLTRPSVATVEVRELLKGAVEARTIKVSSGPLRSCSPFPAHTAFERAAELCVYFASEDGGDLSAGTGGESVLPDDRCGGWWKESNTRYDGWRADYLRRVGRNRRSGAEGGERGWMRRWPQAYAKMARRRSM